MSKTLKRDIYSLNAPGISIDQVKQPDPDPLAVVQYSCLYWVDHLIDCNIRGNVINDLKDGGFVYNFLSRSYLYWLKALSLTKCLPDGIVMVIKLESLQVSFSMLFGYIIRKRYSVNKVDESPDLRAFIHDAKRFALYNRPVI